MFFLLVISALGLAMIAMAVGVILSNRQLRGSCGGVAFLGPDGTPLTCTNCNCKVPEEEGTEAVSAEG